MGQAITFDFHNTLVQCDPWFDIEIRTLCSRFLAWRGHGDADPALAADADRRYRTLREAIISHGHELTAEQCVAIVLDQLNLLHTPDEISEGVSQIMMATLDDAQPVPGSILLIRELAHAGFPLAIVSSAVYHPFLVAALDRFGLSGYIQSVVTSASSGFYKSRPEIFWRALADVGATAEQSVHVGDSYKYDVLGGQRAGLRTVWLSSDPDASSKIPQPDLIIERLEGAAPAIIAVTRNSVS